jgi:Helix-hairpin-helix domain
LNGFTPEELRAIPGVGATAVAALEKLLGRQRRISGAPIQPFPEEVWRLRGIPSEAAITFAQIGMTLDRLASMTREDLLVLWGVGRTTLQACERLLGRAIPARKPIDPAESFWQQQGALKRVARALSKAGIHSFEDLWRQSREDVLALPGIGKIVLHRLETMGGREVPSRTAYWVERGLPLIVARVLVRQVEGCSRQGGTSAPRHFFRLWPSGLEDLQVVFTQPRFEPIAFHGAEHARIEVILCQHAARRLLSVELAEELRRAEVEREEQREDVLGRQGDPSLEQVGEVAVRPADLG